MNIARYISTDSPSMAALIESASRTGKWKDNGKIHQIISYSDAGNGQIRLVLKEIVG